MAIDKFVDFACHGRMFLDKDQKIAELEDALKLKIPEALLQSIGDYWSFGVDGRFVGKRGGKEFAVSTALCFELPRNCKKGVHESLLTVTQRHKQLFAGLVPFAHGSYNESGGYWAVSSETGQVFFVSGADYINPFSGELVKSNFN